MEASLGLRGRVPLFRHALCAWPCLAKLRLSSLSSSLRPPLYGSIETTGGMVKYASASLRILKVKKMKLAASFHTCAIDTNVESFTWASGFCTVESSLETATGQEVQKMSLRSVKQLEYIVGPQLSWMCGMDDNVINGDFIQKRGGRRPTSHIHHLLSTSIIFHLWHAGSRLPVVIAVLQKVMYGFKQGGTQVVQLGGLSDSSYKDEQFESNEKDTKRRSSNEGLRLSSGACLLPHPDKAQSGGEDAYFICPDKQVVGVADGVGGWADMGIDAGEYARQLMNESMKAAQQEPHGYIDTGRILERAHSKTTCKGSSTACILALSDHGLQAANLGDSGFLVVRGGRIVFKSPVQQHNFNFPFQLESGGGDPPTAAEM